MGTNVELDNLTERHAIFVREFVEHGNKIASALAAGYAQSTADTISSRIMRTPAVLAAIHVEIGRRLVEDGALARRVIVDLVKDKDTPAKLRGELAVKLLDRAGHVTPRAKAIEDDGGRSLHELSLDELRDQRERLESEIAGRARQLNAPIEPDAHSQATDMFD